MTCWQLERLLRAAVQKSAIVFYYSRFFGCKHRSAQIKYKECYLSHVYTLSLHKLQMSFKNMKK